VKTCQVRIHGQTYSLGTDMDPEAVRRVADKVDTRMREVAEASPSATPVQVAVLAALDIASEGQGRAEAPPAEVPAAAFEEVESRAAAMIARLESVAPGLLTT